MKKDRKIILNNRNNNVRVIIAMLKGVLWKRQITAKNKLQIYNSVVKITVTYGAEI